MSSTYLKKMESAERVLLNPVESYFWRFEKGLAGESRVAVLIRLDGCIEAEFLSAALRQLQWRHPRLRAAIAESSEGCLHYHFEPVPPPIPFEIRDFEDGETPWREETRRLLQTGFPAEGPLAAATVLRSPSRRRSELILTLPHAIADGVAAIMLADDLLTEYARSEGHLDLPSRPSLPLVRAVRAKPSGGWRGRLWLLRRFARFMWKKRSPLSSLPSARNIPPQSQWMHWVFSREDTLAVVRRCRKEQTSLNGALMAATCCGLWDCMAPPQALFRWQHPFDIREVLEGPAGPVTAQDLGCFMTNMNGLFQIKEKPNFWDLARQAHQEIQMFVQQGGLSFGYTASAVVYRMWETARRIFARSAAKPLIPSDQRVTMLATHYGVLNMREQYGSLHPRECTLTMNKHLTGPSLVLEALVMEQRLNIGFVADNLDPAFWEQLQIAVRGHLESACKGGEAASAKAQRGPNRAEQGAESDPVAGLL
jgi:hypothetical protein